MERKVRKARGESQDQSDDEAGDSQDAYGQQDATPADAQGGKGDDFAVGGHAAKSEQYADKHGHGDCKSEDCRKDAKKQLEDLAAGAGVAHEQLHEAHQLRDEENKGEDDESEERVTKNFADNVTVQYAHVTNGECNMREELRQDGLEDESS